MTPLTVPGHHLLRASDTFRRFVLAPDRCLGLRKLLARVTAGNLAPVVLHVHIWLAACRWLACQY